MPGPAGRPWTATVIRMILANEVYTGAIVWGKMTEDGSPLVRVENAFPAIVSRETFDQVQRLLQVWGCPPASVPSLVLGPMKKW